MNCQQPFMSASKNVKTALKAKIEAKSSEHTPLILKRIPNSVKGEEYVIQRIIACNKNKQASKI